MYSLQCAKKCFGDMYAKEDLILDKVEFDCSTTWVFMPSYCGYFPRLYPLLHPIIIQEDYYTSHDVSKHVPVWLDQWNLSTRNFTSLKKSGSLLRQ